MESGTLVHIWISHCLIESNAQWIKCEFGTFKAIHNGSYMNLAPLKISTIVHIWIWRRLRKMQNESNVNLAPFKNKAKWVKCKFGAMVLFCLRRNVQWFTYEFGTFLNRHLYHCANVRQGAGASKNGGRRPPFQRVCTKDKPDFPFFL